MCRGRAVLLSGRVEWDEETRGETLALAQLVRTINHPRRPDIMQVFAALFRECNYLML